MKVKKLSRKRNVNLLCFGMSVLLVSFGYACLSAGTVLAQGQDLCDLACRGALGKIQYICVSAITIGSVLLVASLVAIARKEGVRHG